MPCKFNIMDPTMPAGHARCFIRNSFKYMWEHHRNAVITGVVCAVAYKSYQCYSKQQRRKKWNSAGKDVVVLHIVARTPHLSNLSPFVMKLETYLRMAGIKYESCSKVPIGPKNKVPWITINSQDLSDSQHIQDFLARKFSKDFSANLNAEQKAVSRAIRIMVEDHLYWGVEWWRCVWDPEFRFMDLFELNIFVKHMVGKMIRKAIGEQTWAQGIGRHSHNEICEMVRQDLVALSSYLGEKPFIMGAEPCELDCIIFGFLAQIVWASQGSPFTSMMQGEFRNLLNYTIRMKERFYPDWDQLYQNDQTDGGSILGYLGF